ncbi:hypothetical protein RO3G_03127 [Lichtheimia corymbifera JMRC:FSU:9682]|uniref:Zn(2)-C6 fungal-type domain-containing protein n=1 Tax=Lichtheimia corymbifera JMRC:FSU:9682 TaxID=1263082 RepID=A0A068RFT9_9FUNG|nr:hypothetical protein RO3G_03127 [Lichtheimia corymbifera JMRC:FSU:9682]
MPGDDSLPPPQQQQQQQPQPQQPPSTVEPRKKRAKIVSACSECRRKKTKCNGERPCRSCQKSSTACIYPSSSHAEDRRNAPNKAALEAIEERLKTIEDMLRAILRSQLALSDLDPIAVNNFLNKDNNNNKASSTSPPSALASTPPPPPPQPATTTSRPSSSPPLHHPTSPPVQRPLPITPSSPHDYRLPSIRNISAYSRISDSGHERHHDLPPIGFQSYHHQHYPVQSHTPDDIDDDAASRKRKR